MSRASSATYDEITVHQHRDADADSQTLDGGDVGLRAARQRLQEDVRLHLARGRSAPAATAAKSREVVAGRERIAFGFEQHDAHRRIALGARQRLAEGDVHRFVSAFFFSAARA